MSPRASALILFSGAGGSTQGLLDAGLTPALGLELEPGAVATSRAAGHAVLSGDLCERDPLEVRAMLPTGPLLVQASPPCQGVSGAGGRRGKLDIVHLLEALAICGTGAVHPRALLPELARQCAHPDSVLMLETVRWLIDLMPDYVILEQVQTATPIWTAIAKLLEGLGYGTWVGPIHAEGFGVAQTRTRAILLASKADTVRPPLYTHSRYHVRAPDRLDPDMPPWVGMAQALDWEQPPWATHMGNVYQSMGIIREIGQPALTVTAHDARGYLAWFDHASPPSTLIRNEIRQWRDRIRRHSHAWPSGSGISVPGGILVTLAELARLQGFSKDYPWQGNTRSRSFQIANAVPPPMAAALARHLLNARGAPHDPQQSRAAHVI